MINDKSFNRYLHKSDLSNQLIEVHTHMYYLSIAIFDGQATFRYWKTDYYRSIRCSRNKRNPESKPSPICKQTVQVQWKIQKVFLLFLENTRVYKNTDVRNFLFVVFLPSLSRMEICCGLIHKPVTIRFGRQRHGPAEPCDWRASDVYGRRRRMSVSLSVSRLFI